MEFILELMIEAVLLFLNDKRKNGKTFIGRLLALIMLSMYILFMVFIIMLINYLLIKFVFTENVEFYRKILIIFAVVLFDLLMVYTFNHFKKRNAGK